METTHNAKRSLAMLTASMLIYGTIGIFRRFIPLSSAMLACFRGYIGGAELLLVMLIAGTKRPAGSGVGNAEKKKRAAKLTAKTFLLLIISGMLIGLNWLLLFEAYAYTTVATATLCYYMQPTIVMLVSPILFGEKLTGKKKLCVLAALAGMVLVSGVLESRPSGIGELKGILYGLGAAALYSSVVCLNKKLPGIDAYQKTLIQLIAAATVMLPYVLREDPGTIHLDATALIMLLVVGIVHTGIAYALYFGSMDGLKAQTVALFSYIDPVSALILSALILHETMTPAGMAGAVLILGAAFIGERSLKQRSRGYPTKEEHNK